MMIDDARMMCSTSCVHCNAYITCCAMCNVQCSARYNTCMDQHIHALCKTYVPYAPSSVICLINKLSNQTATLQTYNNNREDSNCEHDVCLEDSCIIDYVVIEYPDLMKSTHTQLHGIAG